jgi:hypothetical protein
MSSAPTNSPSERIASESERGINVSSQSSRLQSLLDDAVEKYKEQQGSTPIEYQLDRLKTCDSVESVAAVLEERAQAFREFLGHDRHKKMLKSIKRVVHVLHTAFTGLCGAVQVGQAVGSVVRLKLAICSVFLILDAHSIAIPTCENNFCCYWHPSRRMCLPQRLSVRSCDIKGSQTVKDVLASYDTLLELFESLGSFVQRLDIYAKVPPTMVMTEIIMKIMIELLSTLALATKQIKQGRLSESVNL